MAEVLVEGEFSTIGGVASCANLSVERLRQLARAGQLRVVKDARGRSYVSGAELRRFLAERHARGADER